MWYRALSLDYVCIRRSGIIPAPYAIFVPNFVSLEASIAELAVGESHVLNQSLRHSPSLFDGPATEAFASELPHNVRFTDNNTNTFNPLKCSVV